MFQLPGRVLELEFQHRHSDGTWAEMEAVPEEAVPEDPAELDPERDWANGQLFVCKACGEQIRVAHAGDEPIAEATA